MAIQIIRDSDTIDSIVTKINIISSELGSRDNLYNRSSDIVSAVSEFNDHLDSDLDVLSNNIEARQNTFTPIQDSALSVTVQNALDSMSTYVYNLNQTQKTRKGFEVVSSGGYWQTIEYDKNTGKLSIAYPEAYQYRNQGLDPQTPLGYEFGNSLEDTREIEIANQSNWVTPPLLKDGSITRDNFKEETGTPPGGYYLLVTALGIAKYMYSPTRLF